jgi:hypothetical protein
MRTGFTRSQALREKINPAFFDQEVTIMLFSTTVNSLGEEVRTWTEGPTIRALVKIIDASAEMVTKTDTNLTMLRVAKVWAWYNAAMLDNRNKIRWEGNDYEIIDTQEIYGRKRFTFCKINKYM